MSHVANVDVEINSLTSLEQACKNLGLKFKKGQKTYKWYGKFMNDWHTQDAAVNNGYDPETFGKCEHAISVPNAEYEVGVVLSKGSKSYRLIYDTFGNGKEIARQLGGVHLPILKREYAVAVATKQLAMKGYGVSRTVTKDGQIKITGMKA